MNRWLPDTAHLRESKLARTALFLMPLFIAYLAFTVPIKYPGDWDLVHTGMLRAEVNQFLKPHPWQQDNSAYLVFHSSGLRTWYIDVAFTGDTVSSIRIFHEDLHDEVIGEILYVVAYL